MNPWMTIRTKSKETIDLLKDSNWVNGPGLLLYLALGINSAAATEPPALFYSLDFLSKIPQLILFFLWAAVLGALARFMWVNLMFYIGKSLEGLATKRNIDNLLALALVPEFFRLFYLISAVIMNSGTIPDESNDTLDIVCGILTIDILFLGLYRVQQFAYKYVVLNIIVPPVILSAVVFLLF